MDSHRESKIISFTLGTRTFDTYGYVADDSHPNVNLLAVPNTYLNKIIWACLPWVPKTLYGFLKKRWPEWILPQYIVLKYHKGEGWEDDFDEEMSNYARLAPLQGLRIPEYFGETQYRGKRAIILSRIFGKSVYAFDGFDGVGSTSAFPRGEPELYLYLRDAYEEIGRFGLMHEDPLFANFLLVDDAKGKRIVVLDLERMEDFAPERLKDMAFLSHECLWAIERARLQCLGDEVPEHLHWRTLFSRRDLEYIRARQRRAADPALQAEYEQKIKQSAEKAMERMRAQNEEYNKIYEASMQNLTLKRGIEAAKVKTD